MKRNRKRFPQDFVFQLTREEVGSLRSQSVISKGRGGRRFIPYAFTEHGALMAANVLNSERAVETSVEDCEKPQRGTIHEVTRNFTKSGERI